MKHRQIFMLAAAVLMLFGACKQKTEAPVEQPQDNIYQFTVLDGAGNPVSLADYGGQVLLVVNTATQCGFTPQYEELQKLYDLYRDKGFVILDFPCNQFGQQAPGTNEEIHEFCTGTYNITFPQMAKIDVNGADEQQSPLYAWLIAKAPFAGFDTTNPIGARLDQMFRSQDSLFDRTPDIKWNFTKFLIDRDGNVVRRFEPYEGYVPVEAALKELL
ncbi:MAG: glutathione peroxidase [Bacteroidales bacterium]|nr:glutathione peroxidase [Bacteroidales bacterium]